MTSKPQRVSIPFQFTPSGHLVVVAHLGRRRLRLVIDTGAGGDFILDRSVAAKLRLSEDSAAERSKAQGLGTASHTTQVLLVAMIRLGPARFERPHVLALDLTHVRAAGGKRGLDGLLGGLFLRRQRAVLDYDAQTLTVDAPPAERRKSRVTR